MAVELATGYVSIVPSAVGVQGSLAKLLGGPASAAGLNAGKQAGAGLTSGVTASTSAIGATIKRGVVLPLLGVGIAAIVSAKTVEDAQNTIIRSTGATGKAAESLKTSFKSVAGQTPADLQTVATVMAEVSQRTGLTGGALEKLTLQTVAFNRITKDSPLNVQELTKTLAGFNIPAGQMSTELDKLFRTSQATGVPLADLVSTLGSAGPIVRQFGIPLGDSAALLAKFDKAGISSSAIMPGLRKAFIGFAKAGQEPGKALKDTIRSMNDLVKAGDVAGARQLAVKIFGSRGSGLVDAAVQGKLSLDNLADGIGKSGKGILDTASSTGTLSGKLGVLKNNATLFLSEIGKPVLDSFTALLKKALPVVQGMASGFSALPGPVKQASVGLVAVAALAGPLGKVGRSIAGIGRAGVAGFRGIAGLASKASAGISGFFKAGGGKDTIGIRLLQIRSAAGKVGGALKTASASVLKFASDNLKAAASAGKTAVAYVALKVKTLAIAVASKIWAAAQWLLNIALNANPISLIVLGIAALVAGFILAYTKVKWFRTGVDAVLGVIKAVANWIINNWPIAFAVLTGGMSLVAGFIIDNWDTIKAVVVGAINFVRDVIAAVVSVIVSTWQTSWAIISTVVSTIWDGIKVAVQGGLDLVSGIFNVFVGVFRGAWDGFWNGLTSVVDTVASTVGSVFGGVVNVIKRAWNGIANIWNNTIGKISFGVPDWVPVVGGKKFDMPDLPTLAHGAIIRPRPGGTQAIIGEAGQSEAVIPLPKLRDLIKMVAAPAPDATPTRAASVTIGSMHVWDAREAARAIADEQSWAELTAAR